jgi:hypothetical protein
MQILQKIRQMQNLSKALKCELFIYACILFTGSLTNFRAPTAMMRAWKFIVLRLEDTEIQTGEEATAARPLLKKLKSFKFVITICFLIDFLGIFTEFSFTFQKRICSHSGGMPC